MSPSLPLVTIAIPTYNRAQTYLPLALASALNQTYSNIEIVVSDNCSSDRTPAFVASKRDSRIRYYRQSVAVPPNDNFNFCLEQALGEYFLLLLDDELLDPDFVSICMDAAAEEPQAGLIRTGLRMIDANGVVVQQVANKVQGLNLSDFFLGWFAGDTTLYLCNTLFRTECLRAVGGLNSRHNLFQDVMAQVKVAARAPRLDIAAIKASTRSHGGQFTYSAKVNEWSEDSLELLELIVGSVPDNKDLIRARGVRFFARICYSRASAIQSSAARLRAYGTVYQKFGRQCLPPWRMVLGSTALYRGLRTLKRRLKGQSAWAAAS